MNVLLCCQNTAQSYKICLDLVEESESKEHVIPKRANCFAIALSLRQVS